MPTGLADDNCKTERSLEMFSYNFGSLKRAKEEKKNSSSDEEQGRDLLYKIVRTPLRFHQIHNKTKLKKHLRERKKMRERNKKRET